MLGIIAIVAVPLAVVSIWCMHTITSAGGYDAALDPLATQPAVRANLASATVQALYSGLPPGSPITQANESEHQVTAVVDNLYQSPEFVAAWDRAVAQSHPQAVNVLTGRRAPDVDTSQGLVVNVTPFISTVLTTLDRHGIPYFDSERTLLAHSPPVELHLLTAAQLREARSVLAVLSTLGWALPVVGLCALALAVVLARDRFLSLAGVTTGAAVLFGLLQLALAGAVVLAVHRAQGAGVTPTASSELLHTLFHGLTVWLWVGLGVAGAVAVGSWVIELVVPTGRHRRPRSSTPGQTASAAQPV